MLGFQGFLVGVGRDVDWRGEEDHRAGEGRGKQKMIPGFFEGLAAIDADMEDHDRAAGFSCEDDRTGLRDVAWAAWAVDGEGAIDTLFEAFGHDREAAQSSAR